MTAEYNSSKNIKGDNYIGCVGRGYPSWFDSQF